MASAWLCVRAPALALLGIFSALPSWAALTVNSIDLPTRIGRGQTVLVQVQVTRVSGSGPETVTVDSPSVLEVVAPLPAGCSVSGAVGSAQVLTCTAINPVGTGAIANFSFNMRGRALGGGNVTATFAGPPVSSASDSFTVVSGGDLTVAKTMAPSTTLLNGQTATFTLTPAIVTGDSIPVGSSVTVTDQLPGSVSEFTLTSVSAPGYSCDSVADAQATRLLRCTASGPLASLGPIILQGRPTLAGSGGLVNNAAIAPVGSDYIDINPLNDSASRPFTVEPGSDPSPAGSFPAPTMVSTPHTLLARYINGGPQTLSGGLLRLGIPAGFVIGSLPPDCVNSGPGTVNGITGTVLTCTAGTIAAGGEQVFAFPLTTPATPGSGQFGLQVVTGPGGALPGGVTDIDTGNNLALVPFEVIPPYADLALSKSKTPGPQPPGALLTSTISVTNTGVVAAVYTAGAGPRPLRVVDTMSNDELFVSASAGWSCTDGGVNSAGAGQRRVACLRDAAGTLAVGDSLPLTLTTRVSPALGAPRTLVNRACTGATVLSDLGLPGTAGPQPPDGNQNAGADCADASTVGTPVISGQAQAGVRKESSSDGSTWVDSPATPPVVAGAALSHFWRITITTPSTAANPAQQPIPTLNLNDTLPAILNTTGPAVGVPSHQTPAPVVSFSVPAGTAGGSCTAPAAGAAQLDCRFTGVAPGTTITVLVRVDRPFEAGTFTNTATVSSPDAILTPAAGAALSDAAAITLAGRTDPSVTSKTVTPPNSATEPRVGQVVSYTIVARNLGPNLVDGPLTVSDSLPTSRFLILDATPVGSGAAPPMTCSVNAGAGTVSCSTPVGSQVPRYDFYTVVIRARVLKTPGMPPTGIVETFTNTASVALDASRNCEFRLRLPGDLSGACNDAEALNNNQGQVTVDIKVPLVDMVQKKARVLPAGQSAFGFGDTLRYRFRAQASGVSRAEGVRVTDRLSVPAGYSVNLVAVAAVNAVPAESGFTLDTSKNAGTVTCTQAAANADVECTLAAGAANFLDPASEVNFDLAFSLTGPAAVISLGNTARICSDESLLGYESSGSCVFTPAAAAGNNIAAVNEVIFPKTDLAITKSRLTASPVAVNQPVQWSLVLQNRGADETAQVRVSDQLPAGFEFIAGSVTATAGSHPGLSVGTVSCTATPASVTSPATRQTVDCTVNGSFPGSTAAANTVTLLLSARAKEGVFVGPYGTDLANDASISPGLDGGGQPLSIDTVAGNNTSTASVQVVNSAITGLVFEDRQRGGADAGTPQGAAAEPRIAGVTLNLSGTDAFGSAVTRSVVTDADGRYTFANLPPSNGAGYTLRQGQPAGFDNGPAAPPVPATGGSYVRGGSAGNSLYTGVVLPAGVSTGDYLFPELRRPSLGGFVYIDVDANGTRSPGTDLPISGATVRLLDAVTLAVIATTTTDGSGAYRFDNLDPLRALTLEQPLPASPTGLANGPVNAGLIGGAACASGCTAQPDTPTAGTDRIAAIDLGAGVDGTVFNFGEVQLSSVSGLVWIDRSRDGVLDAAESGRLPGVTLRLVQGADCTSGTVLQTTTTDATGAWRFDNVRAFQNYLVCQTQPPGYGTGSAAGVAGANSISVSNLPAGGSNGNNFGEVLAALSGSVYQDTGAGTAANFDNGVRDAGEPGIEGVPVTLSGTDVLGNAVSLSTLTDATGNYRFDDLIAPNGDGYTVVEGAIPPAAGSFLDGRDRAGTAGGTVGADRVDSIALAAGQVVSGYTFGELPQAAISGTVYIDRDRDDTLDATPTDGRIAGVTLRLVQGADCSSGTTLQTTTSDATGGYAFSGVAVGGSYLVCQSQPAGYANGSQNPGTAGASPAANVIGITSLPAGGSSGNHFGERVASLAGAVYADFTPGSPALSDNGQRDAGETGIAGVTVNLSGIDAAGNPVSRSTTTDATGAWRFDDLLAAGPGGYTVVEGPIPPAAGVFNDGRERVGTAGGSSTVNDRLDSIALAAGADATGYLFGELPIAPITGTVYLDRDGDGLLDPSPTDGRLPGVELRLVAGDDCSAPALATTSTDASGNYTFSGVSAGLRYSICQTQPTGYGDGATNPGAAAGSTLANRITIDSLPVGGSAGNHFGERGASLAGRVFLDGNNDGSPGAGEAGIAGVTVTLSGVDAAGNPVTRSTTTDATGAWRFDDLVAAGPAGYTVTEQAAQPVVGGIATLNGRTTAGSTGGSASAVAATPSVISAIALPAGGSSTNHLFAEILPVGLAGTVFIDLDNNGLQNLPADLGLGGVPLVVTGTDDTGTPVTRNLVTAPDGRFAVVDLRPGVYTITQPTQPAGTTNGSTLPGSAGGTATPPATLPSAISGIDLRTPGTQGSANNFAEIPNNSVIDGRVWLDADNDGSIGGAERGIAGVTIELTGTDTAGRPVTRSTVTDADGRWRFDSLAPGNYTVTEPAQPPGTVNGTTLAGPTGGTPSAVASTPSRISGIVLGVGESSTDNRFGEVPAGAVAGLVWADNDNDGRVDPGESGLAGVTLVLTGTDDQGNPVNRTVVTDADGRYRFDGLRPGTYLVTQPVQPAGTVDGQTRPGSAGGAATAPGAGASVISGIVLAPGVASIDNNFGELAESPDLRVSKSLGLDRFTVGFPGRYTIRVRNSGEVATRGEYTVRDRLPPGLTLAAVPTGAGWACTGAVGATQLSCSRGDALAAGATAVGDIEIVVAVAAAAADAGSVDNAVLVEGGGEIEARGPTPAQRDAFAGNPAALPVCGATPVHEACRRPTPVQRPGAVSGTVWHDVGAASRLLDGGDRRLAGWLVEVVDAATGTIVGRATTDRNGAYRVGDLLPGTPLAVRFREPGSGVVFGYPVNGETAPGSSGASCLATPTLGSTSSCAGAGADATLTVVLAPGQELPQQSLPVDPSGVVYDSGLRQAVPGAVVTLRPDGVCSGWNPATQMVGAGAGGYTIAGDRISMTVGADGFYQFLFTPGAPPRCNFALEVVPPAGYSFVSTAIPPSAGPLLPPGGPGSVFPVQPNAGAPTGPVGPATSYFLTLSSGSAGANVIHNHIPLDPALPSAVTLAKTGDRAQAEIGDSVRYAITVRAAVGALPRQTTVVDRLPAGFTYIRGTATANGVAIADPQGGIGPQLAFNLGAMPASREIVLHYRVRIGVGAAEGDGLNRARAHACGVPAGCVGADFSPLPGSIATNEGQHRVRVSGGVFGTAACFAGKIFVDCNNNHVQDPEELGIPGVRLVMQDGTSFVSDSEGKYSMCGLPPKSHVLKVDGLTLPRGSHLTTTSSRNLGDAHSRWLDLKNGELHRADFAEGSCSNTVIEQVKARRAQGEVRAPETERRDRPALRFDSKAHGLDTLRSPAQGTDGANQQAPKPRQPAAPSGPAKDETNTPTPALPMNRPPPQGRHSGQAPSSPSAAASGGAR